MVGELGQKRKTRSDSGVVKVTERDVLAVSWVIEQEAVRVDHLQILLARLGDEEDKIKVSLSRALQTIDRWERAGWVAYEKRWRNRDEPGWVYATTNGIRYFDYEYPMNKPSITRYAHLHAANFLRLWFPLWIKEKGYIDYSWKSERHLKWETNNSWAHYPDSEVSYVAGGDRVLVAPEAELTNKGPAEYGEIIDLYNGKLVMRWDKRLRKLVERKLPKGPQYDSILYFPSDDLVELMRRTFEAHRRFRVLPLSERKLEDGSTLGQVRPTNLARKKISGI